MELDFLKAIDIHELVVYAWEPNTAGKCSSMWICARGELLAPCCESLPPVEVVNLSTLFFFFFFFSREQAVQKTH